jgi:hypothetical protein
MNCVLKQCVLSTCNGLNGVTTLAYRVAVILLPCIVWNSTNPGRTVRVEDSGLSAFGISELFPKIEHGGSTSPVGKATHWGGCHSHPPATEFFDNAVVRDDCAEHGAKPRYLGRRTSQ